MTIKYLLFVMLKLNHEFYKIISKKGLQNKLYFLYLSGLNPRGEMNLSPH